MWGFITSVDNLIASLGIPSFLEPIRANNSEGVPCQKSLSPIALLIALANLGSYLNVQVVLRSLQGVLPHSPVQGKAEDQELS